MPKFSAEEVRETAKYRRIEEQEIDFESQIPEMLEAFAELLEAVSEMNDANEGNCADDPNWTSIQNVIETAGFKL